MNFIGTQKRESSTVNEPSVFELSMLYCIMLPTKIDTDLIVTAIQGMFRLLNFQLGFIILCVKYREFS